MAPQISISICTYNRYDVLPKAIDSALNQSLPKSDYRIFVVDNSPDHDRAEAFGERYKGVENLSYVIEKTPGLSNARNVSARICGTEFISFMDDDAIASPTWLEKILEAFEAFGQKAMIVGGRVNPLWSLPRPPWLHDGMLGNLSVVDWGGHARIAKPNEWFAGTNVSFRAGAVTGMGGFAINLGRIGSGASLMSNEEMHLVEKIREAGGLLIYAPEAQVEHLCEPGRLTRSWFRKRSAWQAVSDYMMQPQKYADYPKGHWPYVMKYFAQLPPHERTVRGLVFETDDPELFRQQIGAVYEMTIMTLAGFQGVVP